MNKRIFALITMVSLTPIQPALAAMEWSWSEWGAGYALGMGIATALQETTVGNFAARVDLQEFSQRTKELHATPEEVFGQYKKRSFGPHQPDKPATSMLSVNLPGYDNKTIEVEIHPNNTVLIKAFRKQRVREEKDDQGTIFKEVSQKSFRKEFPIPQEITITDMIQITAEYQNNILRIRIALNADESINVRVIKPSKI